MKTIFIASLLLACGTLPHPIERGIGYDYAGCTKDEKQGSTVERSCRAEAEAKCTTAKHHKNCFVDYAYDARSR